ncbi:hypothetical protein F4774DRAFT_407593 [Daldinia eschscholtzii]|nr:hypothetical protein F4774DRAFT_407593 [Daldinia eschscholtzii]
MMTREHHRRRSPETSRRRRKERRDSREQLQNQQIALPAPPPEERNELITFRSRAPSPLSSSSSTSSSLVNISRPSRRFGLGAFFGGGGGSSSSGRKQHRVKKKRSRFLRFGNSSSSSVGSDLAYGKGYVERRRSREFSPPSSSAGRPRPRRDQTDEEILELGRQFAEIARKQNAEDLKAAGRSRPSTLVGAATVLSQFRRTNSGNSNRGVGSSKPRLDDSSDDSEWESASEDESSSSEFDSGLAYGSSGLSLPNTINQPLPRQSTPSSSRSPRPSQVYGPPLRRKSSVVDPRLFGPVNSLRGYVDAPCGFETVDRSTVVGSPRPYDPSGSPSEAVPITRPLQLVYPVATSDPNRVDVARGPVVSSQQDLSNASRPAPVPLQQPRPIAPVSRSVFESGETESSNLERVSSKKARKDTTTHGSATVASEDVSLGSDRKDDHDQDERSDDRYVTRSSKRSDAGVRAEKDEKRMSRHESPPRVRENSTETRQQTLFGYGPKSERDSNWEKIVPEIKRKFEKEGRRRDEHDGDIYDYDPARNKHKENQKDGRKIDNGEAYQERRHTEDRVSRSDVRGYEPVTGPEYPTQEAPIDPFQFQVADDAFSTPRYTTPKRPLTPNVITVDREPNFSSPEDHSSSERLSRRDSYERQLNNAVEIYEATEHATAPVSGIAFAAAAAAVIAEDRRGRSHEKDVVQEDANRYYREAELARRIKDAETRDAESSVVGKWKQYQQPTIVDVVSPPEMDHPKKKSPYDGPDADVRIDNILEHPKELSRFLAPDVKSDTKTPPFTARDPSAERERPMLNVVRPTPIPTPIPEGQRRPEEPVLKPLKKIDIPPPKVVPAVVTEPQSEVAAAPSAAKSVSWGKNQTKRYVVESPERGDDPYSGAKIVTPAETPRSRTGKKSAWGLGFIAATLGGGSSRKSSSSTSEQTTSVEATEPRKAPRNGDESTNRRASVQFRSTYDSPPVPGPKPSSLKGVQKSGSFPEDPVFTANIAAALESSGFDPKIVIDDANFHKRDSPSGSNDLGAYQSPFVESVTDLGIIDAPGTAASQSDRGHGFIIGEVDTPSDERDISTEKSRILSELNRAEHRKQDKATERDSVEKPHVITDDTKAPGLPRSVTEDEWDMTSNKLSKKVRKRREKAARTQSLDDAPVEKKPRNEQELEAEFIAEGEDNSPKKRPKKSKKAVVVQEDSKQPDIIESPDITVPVDVSHVVRDVNTVQLGTSDRLKENSNSPKRDLEIYSLPSTSSTKPETSTDEPKEIAKADVFTPGGESGISRKDDRRSRGISGESFSRTVLPSELSTASSYGMVDTADSIVTTEDEWDAPEKSEKKSKRDNEASYSLPRSVPTSTASVDRSRKIDLTSVPGGEGVLRKNERSRRGSIDDDFVFPAVRGLEDWDSPNKLKNELTQDSGARGASQTEPSTEELYDSPKEMTESASDVSREKTVSTGEELDIARKPKQSTRSSISHEDQPSTSQFVPQPEASVETSKRSKPDSYPSSSEALNRDANPAISDRSRYKDNQPTGNQTRNDKADDTKTAASTSRSADKKSRKGSKLEADKKSSGNMGFFGRFKSSIGMAEEKQPLPKLEEDKNNSFLDNADIPGAGVGSTGDVIVSQESQSKATNAPLDEKAQIIPSTPERQPTLSQEAEPIDPEIVPREIRPAIDPKHGDLLPLPPSRSGSPISELGDDFPPLPDSRPETPERERHVRETPTHTRRRSTLETPTRPKTPSQSAIPIQFFRPGHRHSSSNGRSSPSVSPITATVEFGSESKNRSRPTSWEASRDFKPLLLLQKALRGSVDLSSSPEREYSLSESEIRERGSPSSAHVFLESPERDQPFRENIFSGPLSSPVGIPVEKPGSPRVTERALQLQESPFGQPSDEASFQRNNRAEGSHLSPLPEEADLKVAEDSHSPFSSPTLLAAPKDRAQGGSAEGPLKDNFEDSAISKAAIPTKAEPETTITPDDRTLSQATKAVAVETPQEFLPVSDLFPGMKTPDSTDTFDTALSNADDREPLESSASSDKVQDNGQSQHETLSETDELSVHLPIIEAAPLQEENLSSIMQKRIFPAEQVEPSPVGISTKGVPEASEQDVDDNESIETVLPESSISEAREAQLSVDVQEPDSDASTIHSQSTGTATKKSKRKKRKRKNRKSHSTELDLEGPSMVPDTQNVALEKLPIHQVEDEVPVKSNPTPIEQPTSAEEKPVPMEELAFSHEKPAIPESKAPVIEIDNHTNELHPEPTTESSPAPLESAVVEKPNTPETGVAIPPEVPSVEPKTSPIEPERNTVESETPVNDPEIPSTEPMMTPDVTTPELVVSSREANAMDVEPNVRESHIEESDPSALQKDILATEDEPIKVESETHTAELEPTVKPEPTVLQSGPVVIESETPTSQTEHAVPGAESALVFAEPERLEQLVSAPELSTGPSEENEAKEKDVQQPLWENEQIEVTSPVEEPAQGVEELTQESTADSHHELPVDQQTSGQDQAETASLEIHDNQLGQPKETTPTAETSEEEEKKIETIAPEPEIQAIDEQTPAQEESQPLSQSPSIPAVQIEDQQPNTPAEGFVEAPTSPILAEQQPNLLPENESTSERALQEPERSSEANCNDEGTPQEILTPAQPAEPILSNPAVDNNDDLQSAVPVLGQDEQPQSVSNPVLEEAQSPADITKPEDSIADGTPDEQLSLTEADLPHPVEQEPSGLALLENTNVDESVVQPDLLGGEDTKDQQGPASTTPLEAPLSSPNWNESSEDKQDKSSVSLEAAEEPSALSLETDDAGPPSLSEEVSSEEVRETTQSLDEASNEKGEDEEISQETSEIVDTSATNVPDPEPASQAAPSEVDVHESQIVSDVPERPPQYRDHELDVPVVEEQLTIPQPIAVNVLEPILEETEPIDDNVLSELDSSIKDSQEKGEESQLGTAETIDAPALSGELESEESEKSERSEKPVGEPTIVETEADNKLPSDFLTPQVDLTAAAEVENQASESESTPNKEEEIEEKRRSDQIETVTNDTPQETPEILDAPVGENKEVTPLTQDNVEKISEDTQAPQAKEDIDAPTTTSIILPEISTEPDFISEDIIQAGEGFRFDSTPSGIEESEKHEEKPQGAQLPGPLEQGSMDASVEPVGETPAPDTTFNPDWDSIDIPPLPDFLSKPEDHSRDAPEAQQEQSHDQPVDPLDQLVHHIEAKSQSEVPGDIQDQPEPRDVNTSIIVEQPAPQKAPEDSLEAGNSLSVENTSKDEPRSVQEPSGEVVPAVKEPANDNVPTGADDVQEPPTQGESQVAPIPPAEETPPMEATPTAVPETQDKTEQPTESITNDSILATPQVDESTRVTPPISEDGQSNPPTEHAALGDSQVESNLLAENKTQIPVNVLPTITEEGESEGQDALDTTTGAAAPMDEPSTEVPPSDLVETPSTIPQDQTNLGEVTPEAPMIVKPEEPVSQPHKDESQSPANEDEGTKKESQVQEQKPESSPLPTEPPTEQPQAPIIESSQPQDVMPLDSLSVDRTKTEPHPTEQNARGSSDFPTPKRSKTASSLLDISPSPTKEPEPRASDVTGTTVHSQDSEQEPGVQTDKAGDDVLITRPEIAPSGEVTNVQDQEKTRQTNDLTENAMLEEEPVAEPVRDDEGLESVDTPRPEKSKESQERGSQSILDDMTSVPSQETAESAPSVPAAVDEAMNSTRIAMPIVSEEPSLPPPGKVDEPIETAITTVQQDTPSSHVDDQFTTANAKEVVEPEPKNPEDVSVEDKEGEENKLILLDDNLSEQVPEQAVKESPTMLFVGEDGTQVLAPTEVSKEEKTDEPASPKKNRKGKKSKRKNARDENASQVELSQVSVDTLGNDKQMESGTSQQSPEGADVIELGPTESEGGVEAKDVGGSDDVQSQEQNQAKLESAAQPDISEITETENLAVESTKDEKVGEVVPTKKSKKNKKKKRGSLRGEETILEQEPTQPANDLVATTSNVDQANTNEAPIPKDLASHNVDLKPDQNVERKESDIQEPEFEARTPAEPEPDSKPEQLESSPMDLSSTDVPPVSMEDSVPIGESPSTSLLEAPAKSPFLEAPIQSTQDDGPSAEDDISAMAPLQTVEEQVENGTLPESSIPLTHQTPTKSIDVVPTPNEFNAEGSTQAEAAPPETITNQELEEQTNVLPISPREDSVSQGPAQSDEKHEETVDPVTSETPVEAVHFEEFPRSGEDSQPADFTQAEAAASGEHEQPEDLPMQEPATSEEQPKQESPKVEELVQLDEPDQSVSSPQNLLVAEEPAQQEPAEPEDPTERSEPELLTQAQEFARPESSATPIQELPVTLDETEPTPTKKSKKSKKKKKATQVESEPAAGSTQLVEPQTPTELPKRSAEQPVDQRAEQRNSWGFFGGLTDSFKSLLSMQEPTTASKTDKNTADSSEALTSSEPKTEEKEASQLETLPTEETMPSLEQEERPSMHEQSQESQQVSSQPAVNDTSASITNAVSEDVSSEVATSKESKGKDNEVRQVSQEPESKTVVALESQTQPVLEESSMQESQEPADALPKVEQPPVPREKEKRERDLQSSGSKMSKKERRKMKKLAALAAELFQPQPESDSRVNERVVPETVPGSSEQPPEPANPDPEVANASIASVIDGTSTNIQEVDSQSPIVETEHSIQPIQEHVEDHAEENGEKLDVPTSQEETPIPSSEQVPTTSEVETIAKDTFADINADAKTEATPDVQELKDISPNVPIESLEKEKEAQTPGIPEISTEVPNSDPQSQSLPDSEKQDETTASTGISVNVEHLPVGSNDIPERVKTPKIGTGKHLELPVYEQLDTDPSQTSPLSRKKSRKDKKKKRLSAQAGLEAGSRSQTPVNQEPNTGNDSSDIFTGESIAPQPERTMVNEGEWLESPNSSPQDKARRKASGTSTPLESIEDALVNASPDTVGKENAPRRLTLENTSEVEGQSSKAKDVEEIPPKPKDQDQNAENINISHPDETSVEVSEITQPPSPVSERHPDKEPLSETRQDISEHIELPEPVTPPRTPSTVATRTVNVDLSPAQLSSHIEHERPFDQSPLPGKRIRTHLSRNEATISEFSPTQPKFSQSTEGSGYEARGLLPPAGIYTTKTSDNNAALHNIIPARDSAVSFLESQLIPTAAIPHNVEEDSGVKRISTSGLLPVVTPRREVTASRPEEQPSGEIEDHENTLTDATPKFVGDVSPVAKSDDISALPSDSQSKQLEPERKEERSLTIRPAARQPNHIEDMTTPARKIAAILMEAHFHSSKKNKDVDEDVDPSVRERISAASPTEEATHSTEKYANMKTPDTQDILDNRAVPEIPEAKALEGEHAKVDASDLKAKPSTEANVQTETLSSKLREIASTRDLPVEGSGTEDIKSPVVGRQVQQSLPEPRTASHDSPTSQEPPTTEIIKGLDDLDTSERASGPSEPTVERKIDEASLKSPSSRYSLQDYENSGRNSPRVLPPVKEETREELQDERQNRGDDTPSKASIITEANRDSGFTVDSPNPIRRSSWDELSLRDSAVHLQDWPESTPKKAEVLEKESSDIRTPQPNEKRSKKLGLGNETPKLSTPIACSQDEMESIDPRKTRLAKSQEVGKRSVSESISRGSTPGIENHQPRRSASNTSISRLRTPEPQQFRPESPGGRNFRSGSNTPPLALRRMGKRMSGDLRSLSSNLSNNNNGSRENLHQNHQNHLQQQTTTTTTTTTTTPVANEGRVRAKDMTDVYDGYGEGRIGSPRSPTRPQSMRRRQSIQVLELESRVEQLVAENRALTDAKAHAEQNQSHRTASAITERDAEIESLKASLEWLRKEVTRLTEINEGLHSANNVLALQHNEKYGRLESQHASAAKELEDSRLARIDYDRTLQEKDSEIQELRAQLEVTKQQVKEMQRQILAQKPPDADFLRLKDEDHFDHRCQQLCQHVQQWVLRFSKFSDMRACRLTGEINDEKIIDRLDNAVLDGSDVDEYLSDRVRRRDIFMSMTMNMIWEFVFTRYLFGMDREHRQKLKSLEKLLLEVGPPAAVRQWRAITLTLLSKRPAFGDQRNQDTEAVVQAVFQTLCMILPPPSNLEAQIQSQLRRVMREAVDLSIEMRTQRAEYMMLPPLQPEYDANGDLVRTVAFNAALMNERSGDSISNEQYEAQHAIVRTVLFPLVVKKGDDNGVGDEEVVICPAQVLVAKPPRRATIRIVTPTSEAGSVPLSRGATPSAAAPSTVSLQMQDAPLPMPTPPQEAEYLEGGI